MPIALLALLSVAPTPPAAPSLEAPYEGEIPGEEVAPPFWAALDSPVLADLIAEGLAANGDVAAAWHRVAQAEALARQQLASLLPQLSGDVRAQVLSTRALSFFAAGAQGDVTTGGTAQLSLGFDPDVTGRQRLRWRATRFDAQASQGDLQAQAVAIASRITSTFLDLVAAGTRVALLEEQVKASEALVELLELRFETGDATALAVLQQRQQLAAVRARLPGAIALQTALRHQLASLVGRGPGAPLPDAPTGLPAPPELPPTGLPAELLENRPDLRAAAARTEAAGARSGAALRDLLPSLFLGGEAGWQDRDLSDLDPTFAWSVTGTLSVPIWLGGANHAARSAAVAGEAAAAASLRQLALQAVAEVETALASVAGDRRQVTSLEVLEEAAGLALQEARERYLAGLTDYLAVLGALAAHQDAQLGLLDAQRQLLGDHLALHVALGGAWTRPLVEAP